MTTTNVIKTVPIYVAETQKVAYDTKFTSTIPCPLCGDKKFEFKYSLGGDARRCTWCGHWQVIASTARFKPRATDDITGQ